MIPRVSSLPLRLTFRSHTDGTLTTRLYHGRKRESNPDVLSDSDIVLTSYHTLLMDEKSGKRPIQDISFFRVVLDEGERRLNLSGNHLI